jgi:hypothetical protein
MSVSVIARLGQVNNTFEAVDTADNIGTLLLTTAVVDTTAPVIGYTGWPTQALGNSTPLAWPYGVPWQSSWVSAQDSFDGACNVTVTDFSHFDPRNLTIQLTASDKSDNSATTSLELMIEAFERPSSEYVVRLDASSSFTVSSQEQVRVSLQRHLGTEGFVIVFPFKTRRRDGNVSLNRLEFGVRDTTTLAWLAQSAVNPGINLTGLGSDLGDNLRFTVYQPPATTLASSNPSEKHKSSSIIPVILGCLAAFVLVICAVWLVIRRQRRVAASSVFATTPDTSMNPTYRGNQHPEVEYADPDEFDQSRTGGNQYVIDEPSWSGQAAVSTAMYAVPAKPGKAVPIGTEEPYDMPNPPPQTAMYAVPNHGAVTAEEPYDMPNPPPQTAMYAVPNHGAVTAEEPYDMPNPPPDPSSPSLSQATPSLYQVLLTNPDTSSTHQHLSSETSTDDMHLDQSAIGVVARDEPAAVVAPVMYDVASAVATLLSSQPTQPEWMHGAISRTQAETRLAHFVRLHPQQATGAFLLRVKKPGVFAISRLESPTLCSHYLLDEGSRTAAWRVNNSSLSRSLKRLEDVVQYLQSNVGPGMKGRLGVGVAKPEI